MRIILIKPNQANNEIIPPLGLGYLASTVRNQNRVEIIDGILYRLTLKSFELYIKSKKAAVFGVQSYSYDIAIVKQYLRIIRKYHPNSIILLGGPHITVWAEKCLEQFPECDFAFIQEAEIGFPLLIKVIKENLSSNSENIISEDNKIKITERNQILNSPELSDIPGLIYRKDNQVVINPNELPIELDNYSPCYDLLHLERYPLAPHGGFCRQYPTAPIIISRGCPNKCHFCCGPLISGTQVRYHSIEYIIHSLKYLREHFGIREFHIEDDNFTSDRKYVTNFCQRLIDEKLNFTWTAANGIRLDSLTEELLAIMVKSGMYSISVGIESSSDQIRKKMGKHLTTHQILEKIQLIKQFPIDLIGFFIIGYPGETKKQIQNTIEFARTLPLKRANFAAFKPFPGTEVYNELIKSKEMRRLDWGALTLHHVAGHPRKLDSKN